MNTIFESMPKKVVVILPTLNEKDNLWGFIQDIFGIEKDLEGYDLEILVVDSGSTDGTLELAKRLSQTNKKIHYLLVEKGLGVGLIKGHQYSMMNFKPDIMAQLDADGQVGVDVLPRLVKAIEEGNDLAIGSRFVRGGQNRLSLSRKIFSAGSSSVCRVLMGPWGIREFTNSARAFTPSLFRKINLDRLPWKERTFIIQPAFLHEAILAGAKYKEVPLIFKNRAEGYSKNKVINYIYDVITYCIDARLNSWGLNVAFFKATRRAKTFLKFGVVGVTGTAIDFIIYHTLISRFGLKPATSKGISTEIAIINNFILNNTWTFRHRKTNTNLFQKFGIFNTVSLGGLAIAVVIIKFLHTVYGDRFVNFHGITLAYYDLYFFVTILPVLVWNFTVNHFITWRHKQ